MPRIPLTDRRNVRYFQPFPAQAGHEPGVGAVLLVMALIIGGASRTGSGSPPG
jgi:hypothetical protein